jgi:hypothetical protein
MASGRGARRGRIIGRRNAGIPIASAAARQMRLDMRKVWPDGSPTEIVGATGAWRSRTPSEFRRGTVEIRRGPPSRLTNCVESRGPKRLTGPQLNGCIRRDGGFGDTWTEREMRPLTVAMLLCLSAAAAQAGLLSTVSACAACRIAPAPEIGSGLPVALAIGGVLLATRLLAHWRRS